MPTLEGRGATLVPLNRDYGEVRNWCWEGPSLSHDPEGDAPFFTNMQVKRLPVTDKANVAAAGRACLRTLRAASVTGLHSKGASAGPRKASKRGLAISPHWGIQVWQKPAMARKEHGCCLTDGLSSLK